jgi:DNA anti-recombination protein RmuC
MRARLIFVVVALLLVAGFAAINWSEFQRAVPLSFGWRTVNAPLGLVMLALLGLVLLAFLISSALQQSRNMIESHRHGKALQAQRDLAEKAATSRFTELKQQLDTHLRENRQREAIAASEFEKAMVQSQRELRNQLELMNRTLGTRLGELESRIETHLDRLHPVVDDVASRERAKVKI